MERFMIFKDKYNVDTYNTYITKPILENVTLKRRRSYTF